LKLEIDLSDFIYESEKLAGQLVTFLREKAGVNAEISGKEVLVKSEKAIPLLQMQKLLKEFMQTANLKGKVKKAKGKTLAIVKSRGKPVFCGKSEQWKSEVEERLKKEDELILYSIGNIKYNVLDYLHKNPHIQILKLETRYMKNREKGLGLKVIIKRKL